VRGWRVVAGAVVAPLAGARVHPMVSVASSSGSVVVPAALSLTLSMRRSFDEQEAHSDCPLGARQGHTGNCGGGEVCP
jgi:hypothetical protein